MSNEKINTTPKTTPKQITKSTPKSVEVKVVEEEKILKEEKVPVYSYWSYCDLIGASSGVRFVAKLKFKNFGKKTIEEWKEIFKEQELI